jgi:hypothetical protein
MYFDLSPEEACLNDRKGGLFIKFVIQIDGL